MSEAEPDIVDRAVALFVYAPVGVGLFVAEATPSFLTHAIERGRDAVTRQVTSVRSTGEVAVAFGLPMLRKNVRKQISALLEREPPAPAAPAAAPIAPTVAAPPTPYATEPAADAPANTDLPIPGYDALSASQVVERLAGLEPSELDAVQAYEAAHRQRRTILGKIEQLAG